MEDNVIPTMNDGSENYEVCTGDHIGCFACERTGIPVLCVDTSGGEYGGIGLCMDCIVTLFKAAR